MHRAVVPASFPATVLVMRVDGLFLLIPWVLLWAIAFAVMPFVWLVCFDARGSAGGAKRLLLRNWHLIVFLLVMMRGTTISVRGRGHRVYLKWL